MSDILQRGAKRLADSYIHSDGPRLETMIAADSGIIALVEFAQGYNHPTCPFAVAALRKWETGDE